MRPKAVSNEDKIKATVHIHMVSMTAIEPRWLLTSRSLVVRVTRAKYLPAARNIERGGMDSTTLRALEGNILHK
jgi:hypothetical protein